MKFMIKHNLLVRSGLLWQYRSVPPAAIMETPLPPNVNPRTANVYHDHMYLLICALHTLLLAYLITIPYADKFVSMLHTQLGVEIRLDPPPRENSLHKRKCVENASINQSVNQYRKCLHRDVASTVQIITVHKIHNS